MKVPPGVLTPQAAMDLLITDKICIGCGTKLDFWGMYPKDYHWHWCEFSPLNREENTDA